MTSSCSHPRKALQLARHPWGYTVRCRDCNTSVRVHRDHNGLWSEPLDSAPLWARNHIRRYEDDIPDPLFTADTDDDPRGQGAQ